MLMFITDHQGRYKDSKKSRVIPPLSPLPFPNLISCPNEQSFKNILAFHCNVYATLGKFLKTTKRREFQNSQNSALIAIVLLIQRHFGAS